MVGKTGIGYRVTKSTNILIQFLNKYILDEDNNKFLFNLQNITKDSGKYF